MMCDHGQVYDACRPAIEPNCDSLNSGNTPAKNGSKLVVEGCFCPAGTVRNGKLITFSRLVLCSMFIRLPDLVVL